ncbi:hypothetical protein KW782_00280 [Candidatus Parcubacteria bacterium]|nr:hypothetical protein [Candidatus Parcubacteria bacterium]
MKRFLRFLVHEPIFKFLPKFLTWAMFVMVAILVLGALQDNRVAQDIVDRPGAMLMYVIVAPTGVVLISAIFEMLLVIPKYRRYCRDGYC